MIREKSKIYKNSQNAIKIKKSPNYLKKMCRVSARRLSIYNFAWELNAWE
jgi:hypothetical protein